MAGAMGNKYTVAINDTDESDPGPQTYTDIECQGDAVLNTGKSLEISRTKNCKHPFFTEAGYTVTVPIEIEAPLGTQQAMILDAADNETLLYVQLSSTDTGVPEWTGTAYAAYDPFTMPTEGVVTINAVLAFVNDPTRATTA